jgi:hypothetical protein
MRVGAADRIGIQDVPATLSSDAWPAIEMLISAW